jgi:thiol-disulfide isomerase/thioredoxin
MRKKAEYNICAGSVDSLNPMRHDLEAIMSRSESVADYLKSSEKKTPRFAERKSAYKLNKETIEKIKAHAGSAVVVVFSAEWCPDCFRNVPVLGLLSEETGLEVRVFGHLMRNVKDPNERWAIPPSPPEVKEFDVVKIPLIIVLNEEGEKLGEIIENPPEGQTLEGALLDILQKA